MESPRRSGQASREADAFSSARFTIRRFSKYVVMGGGGRVQLVPFLKWTGPQLAVYGGADHVAQHTGRF